MFTKALYCFSIVTTVFLLYSSLFAQSYNLRNYTIEDGLPQSQVMDIIQDHKGYLWVATNGGGAARFDGKKFTVFNTETGLADNRVMDLMEDKNNNIWFATQNGISKFDGKKIISYRQNEGLKASKILSICEDAQGSIWIGSEKEGLFILNGDIISEVEIPGYIQSKYFELIFRKIIPDGENGVWVGSNIELFHFEKNNFTSYTAPRDLICGNDAWSLCIDKTGNLWIGSWNTDMCKYDNKQFYNYGNTNGINNKMITALFEDKDSTLWIGSDGGGVYCIKSYFENTEKILFNINENNGLPSNRVRSIYQDTEGNIWFGTDDGLSRFDHGMFTTYNVNDGLKNRFVLSFLQDSEGKIYFGTQSGISILNPFEKHSTNKPINEYKPAGTSISEYIWSMHIDSKNRFYSGTYLAGLNIYDGTKTINYTSEKGLTNNVIFDLSEDKYNNVWIGTDYGIAVIYQDTLYNFNSWDIGTNTRIRSVCPDSKGNVWVGTRSGLVKYTPSGKPPKPADFKKISLNEKIDKGILFSILEDKSGYIWFGNYGEGIVRLNPADNSFITLTTKDGLSDNGVLSLTTDNDYLWIGTVNGINRFNLTDFNSNAEKKFRHFGKYEGFSGVEVNQNAILRDRNGNIWFGTANGAVKYNPLFDRENKKEPVTHIDNVKLFFEDADWNLYSDSISTKTFLPANLVLPYDKNHLSFYFAGICLTAPEKVRFQYKLEGLDIDWSPVTTETYASYPSIPPGEYTFLVKAKNNEGVWNNTPTAFSFKISPPFWKRIWFFVLCTLSGSLLIFLFITQRTRNLRLAKKRLEEEVKARTFELSQKNVALETQKKEIEQKNKDITDSINYASRIQTSILPSVDTISGSFKDSFVLFKPKDIVSGDFYWLKKKGTQTLIAAVDCTGHGVPGALISVVGSSALNKAINELEIINTADILSALNTTIINTFQQNSGSDKVKDGMDIALCSIDFKSKTLEYAGVNNPVWIIRKSETEPQNTDKSINISKIADNHFFIELKPDKLMIGAFIESEQTGFSSKKIDLCNGDAIYLFSDGYADQFGGPKGKKFKYQQLLSLLHNIHEKSMTEQKKILNKTIEDWKNGIEQVDDILVIGIRV
jgi:ligand-binding sensor domain-containing protein/serine phosphatase RsbU (regulator of sigma subunit)